MKDIETGWSSLSITDYNAIVDIRDIIDEVGELCDKEKID